MARYPLHPALVDFTPARARKGEARKAFEVLITVETDECVLWPYGRGHGYGAVRWTRKSSSGDRTHAIACLLHHGPPPFPRAHAAHLCGNPLCLNYRHLHWASSCENFADAREHGVHTRGETGSANKLSRSQVQEIRDRYEAGGISQRALAPEYGVAQQTISCITSGKSWTWLDPEHVHDPTYFGDDIG